ncbi:hypothetical protein ACGFR8_07775 [Streptomyces brevispora]
MIHLILISGLLGLATALYGRTIDLRFIGGLAAMAALAVALLFPEAW